MYDITTNSWTLSDELTRLQREKKAAVELQARKHDDWNDNYELYRNKVKTNRLTQRQAVNIPLMKETIKTLLSRIDEPPEIDWKELSGDDYKTLLYQEVWNDNYKRNKLEIIDVIDKKNVLLYGLSVKKLNIDPEYGVCVSVNDIFDIALDPLYNPWDLESARFIIHQNIFRTVKDILTDERYSKTGKDELKIWANSPATILQDAKNREQWDKKIERLKAMGLSDEDFNYFSGGDVIVNLTEHYTKIWNGKEMEKRVVVYADDKIELLNESLMDLIGIDQWPFVVWSEDPETNDVYPDSVADLVRTPNKVLNVWFSQLIENRTLKNFNMHWYMPGQNYTPQTYTPGPGVMLPAPPGDDINKVIQPVQLGNVDDSLNAIQALTAIVERGSGATAIEKGQPEKGQQTLGEVQILVGKANERATAMSKFYRLGWYELAKKWDAMMQANAPKFIKLYKQGRSGKMYPKRIFRSDWKSEIGYEPQVRSSSERENESVKSMQKFLFVKSQYPNNPVLNSILQKRELELLDLTPEEIRQVDEAEKQLQSQAQQQAPGQPPPQAQGQVNPDMQQITQQLAELASLQQ